MRVNGCKKCKTFGRSAWIREVQYIYGTFERKSREIGTWNRNIVIAATFVVPVYLKKTASRKADKNAKDSIDKKVNAISK